MTGPLDDADGPALAHLRARAKAEIRRQIRGVRKVLPLTACAERSARACALLETLPELARAKTIVAYVAMRKELDPHAACEAAWQRGARVGLPRIAHEAEDEEALALHVHSRDAALVEHDLGMREPAQDAPRIALEDVDVILVPAIALDPRGQRIGYGGGYYDRLLPKLPNAFKVGLVYDFQIVAEAPNDAHDVPVDCLVSDARIIRAAR